MLSFAACKISVISTWFLFLDWTDGPVSVLNYVPLLLNLPSLFYVPSFFFTCLQLFTFLTCLHFFTFLTCPYFFTCLAYLHFLRAFTFLRVSNFGSNLRAFTFFIKCGTTHNQLQQAGICKNEVKT